MTHFPQLLPRYRLLLLLAGIIGAATYLGSLAAGSPLLTSSPLSWPESSFWNANRVMLKILQWQYSRPGNVPDVLGDLCP